MYMESQKASVSLMGGKVVLSRQDDLPNTTQYHALNTTIITIPVQLVK